MVKMIVFDLDGTLIDTMEDYAEKASELMEKHYGTPKDLAYKLYWQTSGLPFREQLEILFPNNEKNEYVSELFEKWKKNYLEAHGDLPEEVRSVFEKIKTKGIKIAVSSNNLQEYVDELTKDWNIDIALGYRGKSFKKGEPHFRFLEEKFGINRSEMIFVGDSLNDARLSKASKVKFIALLKKFSEEEFKKIIPDVTCIKNLHQVLDLIDSISEK